MVYGWLRLRQIPILFFSQCLECYTLLVVKELLYNKKSNFYFCFKKCHNLINITGTNISNYIIKQYYDIIQTFKALVSFKKKQFSRIDILI